MQGEPMDVKPLQPRRNYMCPRYDTCLTDAARSNKSLKCRGCVNEHTVKRVILEMPDVWACLRLLWTVFGDGEPFNIEVAQERLFDRKDWGFMRDETRQMQGT